MSCPVIVSASCIAINTVAGAAGGDILSGIASDAVAGEVELLKTLTTSFLGVATPDVSASTTTQFIQGDLQWLVVAMAVLGLLFAAGRMIWSRKGEAARDATSGMLRLIVVAGAGTAVIALLTKAGDGFSTWILDQATADPAGQIASVGALTTSAFSSSFLLMVVAGLSMIGLFIQIALLLVRSALIIIFAGMLPVSAAASMVSETGMQFYRKTIAWTLAFILFKPAAAIIYAAALRLMAAPDSAIAPIEGTVLIVLATVSLPALLKLLVPMVAPVAGIGTGEVVAAGAGLALGAITLGAGLARAGASAGGAAAGLAAAGGGSEPSGAGMTADVVGSASAANATGMSPADSTLAAGKYPADWGPAPPSLPRYGDTTQYPAAKDA